MDSAESRPPDAALAAVLDATDIGALDDHDLLEVIGDWERVASWVAAQQSAALAELARRPMRIDRPSDDRDAVRAGYSRPGEWVREFADDEVAARLRISRLAASTRVQLACRLERLPETARALREGRIDVTRSRVMADETAALDAASALAVEAAMIESAERLPAVRLRARVRRAVIAVDPVAAADRHRRARCERRVVVTPAADGMADLYAHLPASEAMAIQTAIGAAARAVRDAREPGDERTMDQLRADLFAMPFVHALATGVLDGEAPARLGRRRAEVASIRVTVAASTLLGHDDVPALLHGYGPITAEAARELAPAGRWRRILTDPRSGAVLDVGRTVYRPPADLRRHVEARDSSCRFPGCGAAAERCDLDHRVPYPRGRTSAENLDALCRRHHRLKHVPGVRVTREGQDVVWRLPTGHVYRAMPHTPGVPLGDLGEGGDLEGDAAAEVTEPEPERSHQPDDDADARAGAADGAERSDDGGGPDPPF